MISDGRAISASLISSAMGNRSVLTENVRLITQSWRIHAKLYMTARQNITATSVKGSVSRLLVWGNNAPISLHLTVNGDRTVWNKMMEYTDAQSSFLFQTVMKFHPSMERTFANQDKCTQSQTRDHFVCQLTKRSPTSMRDKDPIQSASSRLSFMNQDK